MRKCGDLADFEKCLKMMISWLRSALIQPRTSSGKSDVWWNHSGFERSRHAVRRPRAQPNTERLILGTRKSKHRVDDKFQLEGTEVDVKVHDTALFPKLVLGCINTDRCE